MDDGTDDLFAPVVIAAVNRHRLDVAQTRYLRAAPAYVGPRHDRGLKEGANRLRLGASWTVLKCIAMLAGASDPSVAAAHPAEPPDDVLVGVTKSSRSFRLPTLIADKRELLQGS
jgi:hypothetical protein